MPIMHLRIFPAHCCSLARRPSESWGMVTSKYYLSSQWGPFGAEWSVSIISPYRPGLFDQEQTDAYSRDTEPCQQHVESPVLIRPSHIEINNRFAHLSRSQEIWAHTAEIVAALIQSASLFFLVLSIHSWLMRQICNEADKKKLIWNNKGKLNNLFKWYILPERILPHLSKKG